MNGTVVSNKSDKTVVVAVQTHKQHPLYKKSYPFTKRYLVHDENNEVNVGDKVIIEECQPISGRKRFKLQSLIERAAIGEHQTVEAITYDKEEDKNKPKETTK
jgi:small subunit ribosomal protein S17